ncbi:MAG: TrmB family transcriptional regulator [SAR202 cluster bacterium]|nr:TrmB family transcriptional regulator [SAR202 cluster bacterium]
MARWQLVTAHGAIFLYLAENPQATAREVAIASGLTERTIFRVIRDLRDAGYIAVTRLGRANKYQVNHEAPVRWPLPASGTVGSFFATLAGNTAEAYRAERLRDSSANPSRQHPG